MKEPWRLSKFVYFGVVINKNGGWRRGVKFWTRKESQGCNKCIREKGLSMDAIRGLYVEVKSANLTLYNFSRRIFGMKQIDRVRNEVV